MGKMCSKCGETMEYVVEIADIKRGNVVTREYMCIVCVRRAFNSGEMDEKVVKDEASRPNNETL